MEVEYVATVKASKEAIWLCKFFEDLDVISGDDKAITLYCDNSAAVANTKKSRHYKRTKQIDQKYQIIREYVENRLLDVCKIASKNYIADPFTKTLVARSFERHIEVMEMRDMIHLLA